LPSVDEALYAQNDTLLSSLNAFGNPMQDIPQDALIEIVSRAGDAILEIYSGDFEVLDKADQSPLTQADLAAHEIIVQGLAAVTPNVPVISEESVAPDFSVRSQWDVYWLVDPLDGTKEFVNRNGEFTVNIALIKGGQPVYGIVGVPVQDCIYLGNVQEQRAWRYARGNLQPIKARQMTSDEQNLVVVASRSHGGQRLEQYLDQLAERFAGLTRQPVGSSLKLCTLASGEADCYPRLGPTSEWDIAAAHAVLKAAGGEVYTFDRKTLNYNSKASLLNPEFIAVADADYDWWDVLPPQPPQG
jgi:3'(2'), 5'-bisphosphate nucleotidase